MFYLKGYNIDDYWIKETPKDGLCGMHCVVLHAHLQEGVEVAKLVRRNTNIKLVSNWEQYEAEFAFDKDGNGSHSETIGMETIEFENVEEFKNFLRSKESEEMWMTQTCIQVVADTYQTKVNTLETNVVRGMLRRGASELEKEGARVEARWTVMSPNQNYQNQGEFADQVQEIFLLNSSMNHYDLLVHRESPLAIQGLVVQAKEETVREVPKEENNYVKEKEVESDTSDVLMDAQSAQQTH